MVPHIFHPLPYHLSYIQPSPTNAPSNPTLFALAMWLLQCTPQDGTIHVLCNALDQSRVAFENMENSQW